jgi:hypothetical protein
LAGTRLVQPTKAVLADALAADDSFVLSAFVAAISERADDIALIADADLEAVVDRMLVGVASIAEDASMQRQHGRKANEEYWLRKCHAYFAWVHRRRYGCVAASFL